MQNITEQLKILYLTRTLIFVFIFVTMFSIGSTVTAGEILDTLRRRGLVIRTLLANLVLVPLLGLLLVEVFPVPADIKAAILMISLAPGGMQALQFTSKVKGQQAVAAGILFILTIVALVVSPVLVRGVAIIETSYKLPYARLITLIVVLLVLPLLAGFAAEATAPVAARRAQKPIIILSNVLFIASVIVPMALKKGAVREIGGKSVAVMLILILGSMVIGWLMGGPDKGSRQVLTITTSMRNVGLALLVGLAAFPGRAVYIAVLAYMLLMVPPNAVFTIYHGIKSRRGRTSESERAD